MSYKQSKRQLRRQLKSKQTSENQGPFNIIKGDSYVYDHSIRGLVDKMILQKLEQDSSCLQPFPYKHMCCLLSGISKQWEKGVYGRELYAGGT